MKSNREPIPWGQIIAMFVIIAIITILLIVASGQFNPEGAPALWKTILSCKGVW